MNLISQLKIRNILSVEKITSGTACLEELTRFYLFIVCLLVLFLFFFWQQVQNHILYIISDVSENCIMCIFTMTPYHEKISTVYMLMLILSFVCLFCQNQYERRLWLFVCLFVAFDHLITFGDGFEEKQSSWLANWSR